MDAGTIEGGCLCRAVRYRVAGAARASARCHCRSCRLASGAPAVAWVVFAAGDVRFSGAAPVEYASSPGTVRSFCGACGTPLTYRSASRPDVVDITTASLDRPDAFAPSKEIWTGERLPWQPLDDALPHYAGSSVGVSPDPA